MNDQYKNSYKATAKELVSLSVYNVGYQLCDAGYQWGPGIRDHYLIHYIISGKGTYEVHHEVHSLSAGDAFLVYPNTEVIYRAEIPVFMQCQTEKKSSGSFCIFTMPEEMVLSMQWK